MKFLFGFLNWISCSIQMDYNELQEIIQAQWRHEEQIQVKCNLIIMSNEKICENDNNVTSHISTIMGTLVQQKHQINVEEANCNMIINMVINLYKGK
jgi:hypothetical protein